jgi:hypothetical protein
MKIAPVLSIVLAVSAVPVAAQSTTPLGGLLDRASAYVRFYVHDFSTMVAEERYVQDSHPMGGTGAFGRAAAEAPPPAQQSSCDQICCLSDPARRIAG